MNIEQLASLCDSKEIAYTKNEPLSGRTTFAIGGAAAMFIEPANEAQAAAVLAECTRLAVPYYVLGNGSNVLFSDDGYDGAVIYIRHGFAEMRLVDDVTVECESGASLKALTQFAQEHALTGLEFAYGIPGSVGGGVYMNAGAYDGEMKNVLTEIFHIDDKGGAGSVKGEEMALSYRHSVYTDKGYIITKAWFRLRQGDADAIKAKMDDYMQRRRDKQPLDMPSAGSTFKRPVGGYASALIDECGLKGKRVGGAMVSEKHAGFVVNAGGATCKDVLDLVALIQETVKAKKGIELEPEIRVIDAKA